MDNAISKRSKLKIQCLQWRRMWVALPRQRKKKKEEQTQSGSLPETPDTISRHALFKERHKVEKEKDGTRGPSCTLGGVRRLFRRVDSPSSFLTKERKDNGRSNY